MQHITRNFTHTLLALAIATAAVAVASDSSVHAAVVTSAGTTANTRCSTENAERSANGVQQRCTRNAKGALRWSRITAPQSPAKVLQIRSAYPDDFSPTSVAFVTAMRDGSLLAGGSFQGAALLDGTTIRENVTYWNSPNQDRSILDDRFLARVSPNFDWSSADRHGGSAPTYESAHGPVVALADGSAIVTGRYSGRITLGATAYESERNPTARYGYSQNAYYARLMPDGSWAWAQGIGGVGGSEIRSAVVTPDGSILFSGWWRNTTDDALGFDAEDSRNYVFLMLVNDAGERIGYWSLPISYSHEGSSRTRSAWLDISVVSAGTDGSVVLVGNYCGTIRMGSLVLPTTSKSKGDVGDCGSFVGRFRSDLSVEWIQELQQVKASQKAGIETTGATVTSNGDIVLTGWLENGPWKFGKINVKHSGSGSFVARIDARGNWRWAKTVGAQATFNRVRATPDNGAVLVGNWTGSSLSIGKLRITSRDGYDGLVAKLSPNGDWSWLAGTDTKTVKGSDQITSLRDITVTPDGTIVVAGYMTGTVALGSTTVESPHWDSTGFIARLSPNGTWK